ncbi:MAG: ferrous iron transport protein A [Flavobacteriales bacterium]
MRSHLTLNLLSKGVTAQILQIADCPYRARLSEMGVLPGEQVMILHKAPLSGPIAIKIGNQMLALRREEARLITVEYEP